MSVYLFNAAQLHQFQSVISYVYIRDVPVPVAARSKA